MGQVERRVAGYKMCPIEGCDWRMITAEFVGSPENRVERSHDDQQRQSGEHMKTHYKPERTIIG